LKAPLGTLALGGLALVAAREHRGSRAEEASLLMPALLFFGALSAIGRPYGTRYVLASIVFLLVACGRLAPWAGRSRGRWLAIGLLLATNLIGNFLDHPFHGSSVNRLAGRPELAYRLLNDSNQDMGGGLKALAIWQRAHG